jgi:hypothetical protein
MARDEAAKSAPSARLWSKVAAATVLAALIVEPIAAKSVAAVAIISGAVIRNDTLIPPTHRHHDAPSRGPIVQVVAMGGTYRYVGVKTPVFMNTFVDIQPNRRVNIRGGPPIASMTAVIVAGKRNPTLMTRF